MPRREGEEQRALDVNKAMHSLGQELEYGQLQ